MGEEPIDFRMEINMRDNGQIINSKVKGCLQRKEKDHIKGTSKMDCLKERESIPMRTEIDMTDISRTTSGLERDYILGPREIILKADGTTTKPTVQDRFCVAFPSIKENSSKVTNTAWVN